MDTGNRYGSHFQEQSAYSSISKYLICEKQKPYLFKIGDKDDLYQISNNSALGIDENMFEQKRMTDEQDDNSNEPSESSSGLRDNKQESKTKDKRKSRKCFKNKESKNKFYARNYRQKKKEKLKSLQEENRFLKQKIDDLTFRLKQTEIQLNRLKHSNQPYHLSSLQSARQSLLKQINEQMSKQNSQIEKLVQLQKQLKNLSGFDSKHKIDLLNYFMSELLENLISDIGFYFYDSLISQKGLWKLDSSEPGRQIDYEICELLGLKNFQRIKKIVYSIPNFALSHLKNFKNLWKNFTKIILTL